LCIQVWVENHSSDLMMDLLVRFNHCIHFLLQDGTRTNFRHFLSHSLQDGICSLTLREERRLRVFENRVLRRVFGPKRDEVTGEWRKLNNEESIWA